MTSNIDPLPANQRREEPTTNDPQAGYVAEQREPLFDRYSIYENGETYPDREGGYILHEDVLAKITSGELIVSKTARIIEHPDECECTGCGHKYKGYRESLPDPPRVGEFCRCGARIIE